MKTNLLAPSVLGWFVLATAAFAAPLTETTAVHTKPDVSSPAISYLKAGTEPAPAAAAVATTPAGWMPVELPGPFQGFVENKDLTKGLDVKTGTSIRTAPQADAAVLATAEKGDKTTITGLRGKWTQISLEKPLVGYIRVGNAPGYLPPVATTPASSTTPMPVNTEPIAAPPTYGAPGPGQPALSTGDSAGALPRQLTGKFVSTRSALHPRRPYDWALVDNSGQRFAYLDISKLLLTEQIDKYIGHFVVVFGAAKPTTKGNDIVIQVESLQLLMR